MFSSSSLSKDFQSLSKNVELHSFFKRQIGQGGGISRMLILEIKVEVYL